MNRHRGDTSVPTFLLTFAVVLSLGSCDSQSFMPLVEDCICPGSTLRFNCTTVGSGITVWAGTVVPAGCQLSLQHNQFQDLVRNGRTRFCPGQLIVATPLSENGICFNSQLTIRNVNADLNGRTVICQHDATEITDIGNYTIMLNTDPFPPPNTISLSAITNGLTFSWENVAPSCSSLTYEIKASSDCGACPTASNSTSITCSGIQLGGDTRMCNISVRAITCGNITGEYSEPLTTTLQAANAPDVTSVIPVYSQNASYLTAFRINIGDVIPVSISGNDVTVQSIQIDYRTDGVPVCGSGLNQSCEDRMCSGEITMAISSDCTFNLASVVTVIVSFNSVLGMGPATTLRIDGSSRNFVLVTPNVENSTITCDFANQLDNSNISCVVMYGQCGQLSEMAQGRSTTEESSSIQIDLNLPDQDTTYCYTVTASNDTFTVSVEGNLTTTGTEQGPSPKPGGVGGGAIAGIVIGVIGIIVIAVIAVIIVLCIYVPTFKDCLLRRKSPIIVAQLDLNESVTTEKEHEVVDTHKGTTSPLPDEKEKLRIQEKLKTQVPVAIKRHKAEEMLQPLDKKYWVPNEWTMSKLERKIRKDLGLSKEQPLYLTVDSNIVVIDNRSLEEVYSTSFHGEDQYLYITYSSTDPNKL